MPSGDKLPAAGAAVPQRTDLVGVPRLGRGQCHPPTTNPITEAPQEGFRPGKRLSAQPKHGEFKPRRVRLVPREDPYKTDRAGQPTNLPHRRRGRRTVSVPESQEYTEPRRRKLTRHAFQPSLFDKLEQQDTRPRRSGGRIFEQSEDTSEQWRRGLKTCDRPADHFSGSVAIPVCDSQRTVKKRDYRENRTHLDVFQPARTVPQLHKTSWDRPKLATAKPSTVAENRQLQRLFKARATHCSITI